MEAKGLGIELDAIRELQKQGYDELQLLELQCYADSEIILDKTEIIPYFYTDGNQI